MPQKIFINFLGANEYVSCNYELKEGKKIENVRFVQEALVQILHEQEPFTAEDKIITFVTEEAERKNWLDSVSRNNEPLEGLASRFAKLDLPIIPQSVRIPEGFSEEQIWEIFRIVYESIPERSVVYFDITHAFRFLPMLGMVLINYARFLKEIEVGGIYYGAFEKLGPAFKVKEMPLAERNAPILELSGLTLLNDWTNAANNFFEYGRAEGIQKIVKPNTKQIKKDKAELRTEANLFERISNNILDFSVNILTNRGRLIVQSKEIEHFNQNLKQIENSNLFPPINPIIERLLEETQKYKADNLLNAYHALAWAIKHKWVQQAITQMDEFLISFILADLNYDWGVKSNRNNINKAIKFYRDQTSEKEWKVDSVEETQQIKELISKISARSYDKKFLSIIDKNKNRRNSVNHGGYNDNLTGKAIQKNLTNNFQELTQILKTHWPDFLPS
jgi:CRISPR-associated Csx2 family protein